MYQMFGHTFRDEEANMHDIMSVSSILGYLDAETVERLEATTCFTESFLLVARFHSQ